MGGIRRLLIGSTLSFVLGGLVVAPSTLVGQAPDGERWPLQPTSREARIIAPFLEGWYLNDDGTVTYSFGYLNLNEETVEIPIGRRNSIEPERFSGMQPTVFLPGRRRGVFAVTVPASMRSEDIFWRIAHPDGQVSEVPGTSSWSAYRLDWSPRPHGTVPPEMTFEGGQQAIGPGLGPAGVIAEQVVSTRVGVPTTLSLRVREISVPHADETDPTLLRGRTPVRVVWAPYQGPLGSVIDFTRHLSTPIPDKEPASSWRLDGPGCYAVVPCAELDQDQIIEVLSGEGPVRVVATFSEPGDYLVHAQADNFGRPDSGFTDQCCFTNAYVKVSVRP